MPPNPHPGAAEARERRPGQHSPNIRDLAAGEGRGATGLTGFAAGGGGPRHGLNRRELSPPDRWSNKQPFLLKILGFSPKSEV